MGKWKCEAERGRWEEKGKKVKDRGKGESERKMEGKDRESVIQGTELVRLAQWARPPVGTGQGPVLECCVFSYNFISATIIGYRRYGDFSF